MKHTRLISGFFTSLLLLSSCSEIAPQNTIKQENGEKLIIEATTASYETETKTIRDDAGNVYWNPNDEISLFFMNGENGGAKFISQNNETTPVAQFSGSINGITGGGEDLAGDAYFWAVYPYSQNNSCDGNSITTTLPNRQSTVENTFADDLFITIARSSSVKMAFKNVCGGIKFCVSQSGIKSVVFRGNNEEVLAGTFQATFDTSGTPTISKVIDAENAITVNAPNGGTFEVGKFYYIVALPSVLQNGFTMTFNKTDGSSGVYTRTTSVEIKRSIFGTIRNLDQDLEFSTNNTPKDNSESGFYLGIIGFNQSLHTCPIGHLSAETADVFYSFINGLSTNKGTLLYYAVDKSIDALQAEMFPSNLYDVAIVTFTDGLDSGSLDANDYYLSNSEYSTALKKRLSDELVADKTISAYSIGVKGDDVGYNTSLFQQNLKNIATSTDNVFEVTNMSEVNSTFMQIADLLGETKYVQSFLLEISSPSVGVRCRFTFDNVSKAADSKQYIEATFIRPEENRSLRTLCDLVFVGFKSSTTSPVIGVKNESNNKYAYLFEGLQTTNGALIPTNKVQYWYKEGSVWQKDSEFYFDPGTAGIEKIKRSAAILLNLDCSSSLGDDFTSLQSTATSFVDKLIENAIDPNEVASVKLNKSAITLTSGSTATLTATVLPTTALKKDVEWSSTNSVVASVDKNGKITANSPGSTTIIAKTVDGGLTAVCYVSVVTYAKEVQLNHSEISVYTGESLTLQATVYPENTSNKSLLWSSANTAVATIDSNGNITPIKAGQTTITATTTDGSGVKSTCVVKVLQHVNSISLGDGALILGVGETKQLQATILPSNASNKNIIWSTSDKEIVSINEQGVISALKKGSATITATSEDGGKKASCDVEVRQYVTSIVLSTTSTTLALNETIQLIASIYPEQANNNSVKWSSSNTAVASVDQTGFVTAKSSGTTTISASAQDGSGVVSNCSITVKQPVTSIELDSSSCNLDLGSSKTLFVNIQPNNASDKQFTVKSSNTSVATVTKSGTSIIVRSVGLGNATITVTSNDGQYTAQCNVTVSLSQTPSNLSLAVKKNNIRYFIPQSVYSSVNLSGYTKEGIVIVSSSASSASFILALNDASNTTYTFANAKKLGTLPTNTQANLIVTYWASINSALSTYGGTPFQSSSYWTCTSSGTNTAYCYNSSSVSSNAASRSYYVRKIIATLTLIK